jgi:hypothetical protein
MAESITGAVKDMVDESKRETFAASIRLACQNAADALRATLQQALGEDGKESQQTPT